MAIFTVPGKDIIKITDKDYYNDIENPINKVHII
jgi:hypothetical protein